MQRISEDTHICYAVLRGKSNLSLFEEEIQKKKILDAAMAAQGLTGVRALGYCVLDEEAHFVLEGSKEQTKDFAGQVRRIYGGSRYRDGENKSFACFRKDLIRELDSLEAAWRYCKKLHILPVKQGIASRPEDYWWCSYRDYTGRVWLPVADTQRLLERLDGNLGKAVQMARKQHKIKKIYI